MQISSMGSMPLSSGTAGRPKEHSPAPAPAASPFLTDTDRAQAATSAAVLSKLTAADRAFLQAATGEVVSDGAIAASAMAMDIAYARENGTLDGPLDRAFFDQALESAQTALAHQASENGPGAAGASDSARTARDYYLEWWAAAQQHLGALEGDSSPTSGTSVSVDL